MYFARRVLCCLCRAVYPMAVLTKLVVITSCVCVCLCVCACVCGNSHHLPFPSFQTPGSGAYKLVETSVPKQHTHHTHTPSPTQAVSRCIAIHRRGVQASHACVGIDRARTNTKLNKVTMQLGVFLALSDTYQII